MVRRFRPTGAAAPGPLAADAANKPNQAAFTHLQFAHDGTVTASSYCRRRALLTTALRDDLDEGEVIGKSDSGKRTGRETRRRLWAGIAHRSGSATNLSNGNNVAGRGPRGGVWLGETARVFVLLNVSVQTPADRADDSSLRNVAS